MILVYIIAFLLVLVSCLLVAPISLQVNTKQDHYAIQWKGIARARVIPENNDLFLVLRILFWEKRLSIYELGQQKKKEVHQIKKTCKKSRTSKDWMKRGWKLLKTFKILKFRLNMDTGDFVRNSYLYPIFYLASRRNRQLSINYQGQFEFQLLIKTGLTELLTP